jgi:hypothetical protein
VSKSFAKRYFPGCNALGRRLGINGPAKSTIVGIVGDVRHSSLEEAPEPIVFAQNGSAGSVVIRTLGSPIVASVRKEVTAFGAGSTLTDIQTMSQYVDQAAARRRFQTVALTSIRVCCGVFDARGVIRTDRICGETTNRRDWCPHGAGSYARRDDPDGEPLGFEADICRVSDWCLFSVGTGAGASLSIRSPLRSAPKISRL